MTFSTTSGDGREAVPAWVARALDRSLSDTRARSVERLSQFVDAARQLATETGSSGFTVQQVVQRSGQSLKSFYRYFGGKDDLLLALIEEDSRIGAAMLAELVDRHADPTARLRAYVDGIFTFLSVGDRGYVSVLSREHRRLAAINPEGMRVALHPFLELLEHLLSDATAVGAARAGDVRRDADTVFDLVLANIHELALGTVPFDAHGTADYLWQFCWSGLVQRDTDVNADTDADIQPATDIEPTEDGTTDR